MNYIKKLNDLMIEHGGIVLTKQVSEAGIPRTYIAELVKKGVLERLDRGAYITKDSFDDDMFRLHVKYASAVFSHDTALFLHDLTDRDPLQYTVTVPAGYNSQNIQAVGVKVFSIKKELYDLGLTTGRTMFGREIRCYNMERTICDILRSRNQMDIVIVTDAIKRYAKRKDKNLPQLMRYAESLRVTKLLRSYMEVLL
jgi:predicted transcriptional regulator of viral defense system